jgi:hypothetical protein
MLRGVRAETVRVQRTRTRDEATVTLGARDEIWRAELDVDRVGEENFETDSEMSRGRGMRVVSGNAATGRDVSVER